LGAGCLIGGVKEHKIGRVIQQKCRYLEVAIVKNTLVLYLIPLSLLGLIACGGSSNKEPVLSNDLIWTINVFEDEAQFKNFCQSPRTGTDPFTGNPYPDREGNTLAENHWLRSWSNNTYLWYDEITDNNPANFSTTEDFFDQLKTEQTSNTGQPKDKFHFTYPSDEWQQLTQSGISAGYGADWAILERSPPRKILVAYTEPNTPATDADLPRGAEILEIDGVDAVNDGDQASVDIINAALFPSDLGESHEFVIREVGQTATRTITMISQEITSSPVQNVTTVDTQTGKVGYMLFNSHIATAEEQLINAVNQLSNENIDDLVLDLRYNGGGLLAIASQLAYMIAGSNNTSGQTFDRLVFNNKHTVTNPVTGNALSPTPFYSTSLGFSVSQGQPLPTLNLDRVFILSTDGTCSASEAIINGLRGVDIEVILIGDTTCGKPYGFYPTDNCGTTYFTVQFRGENAKGFGDYSDGFSPANTQGTVGEVVTGCSVGDDFQHLLGDVNEGQFKAALDYRITGSCPIVAAKTSNITSEKPDQRSAIRTISSFEKALILENQISRER